MERDTWSVECFWSFFLGPACVTNHLSVQCAISALDGLPVWLNSESSLFRQYSHVTDPMFLFFLFSSRYSSRGLDWDFNPEPALKGLGPKWPESVPIFCIMFTASSVTRMNWIWPVFTARVYSLCIMIHYMTVKQRRKQEHVWLMQRCQLTSQCCFLCTSHI